MKGDGRETELKQRGERGLTEGRTFINTYVLILNILNTLCYFFQYLMHIHVLTSFFKAQILKSLLSLLL